MLTTGPNSEPSQTGPDNEPKPNPNIHPPSAAQNPMLGAGGGGEGGKEWGEVGGEIRYAKDILNEVQGMLDDMLNEAGNILRDMLVELVGITETPT